ncbi:hypothetical protein F8388_008484 [Cannabis sativa]|uniref:Uncharacterized protein n=1 Tax=Cannabis sativa TaxID=3483 RepID=A0A7J6EI28_CANSA|nr:hypothetical protein F8388_008484 [Cannabis sativa]
MKTTNILLDENFVAKVAYFGLSKTGPSLDQTHVLSTRPALNPVLPRDSRMGNGMAKKGMLDHIMDPILAGKVNMASFKKFGETTEYGVDKPSMGDVLWNLEYALQLKETSFALMEPDDNNTNHISIIQLTPIEPFDNSCLIFFHDYFGSFLSSSSSLNARIPLGSYENLQFRGSFLSSSSSLNARIPLGSYENLRFRVSQHIHI